MLMIISLTSAPSPGILFLLPLHLLTRETPELITDHIPFSLSKRFLLAWAPGGGRGAEDGAGNGPAFRVLNAS